MMVLGLLSILGMYFVSSAVADMAFLVGSSSLTMGTLWLVTSDFGFQAKYGNIFGWCTLSLWRQVLSCLEVQVRLKNNLQEDPTEVLPTVDVAILIPIWIRKSRILIGLNLRRVPMAKIDR